MKKADLNQNIHLSEGNIKSKNTDDVIFLTWSLPCKITCTYSTEMCRNRCFAQKNQYFKSVLDSRMRNWEETKKDTFVQDMIDHLEYHLSRKKMEGKKMFVRIHTSGDFYSLDYFEKWIEIAEHFRNNNKILFQAYTKSMPIIHEWGWKEIDYDDETNEEIECWTDNEKSPNEVKGDLDYVNIHFVWSIWDDTPKEYTELAEELGLQTFTALPKDKIAEAVENGAFECKGDCGNCRQCYTGKAKEIVIPYH